MSLTIETRTLELSKSVSEQWNEVDFPRADTEPEFG